MFANSRSWMSPDCEADVSNGLSAVAHRRYRAVACPVPCPGSAEVRLYCANRLHDLDDFCRTPAADFDRQGSNTGAKGQKIRS